MLGAVRQQAITWTNVDPDLCRHMASLGHNELSSWALCHEIDLRWMPLNIFNDKSTLVQAMAWYYQSQCWPRFVSPYDIARPQWVNKLMPKQNSCHFFRFMFSNEGFFFTLIFISLKFVPKGPIKKKSALVQVMAWRLIGDEPLPETMKTKICWCIGTRILMRCSAKLSFALCYVQLHFFWGSSWKSMECFDSNKS